ncbi:MAG: sulfatase [Candidatus Firestonebacteria bacterium]
MRIIYFDIDTLRPDHLGCYGYGRNTSPNIDRIAKEGVKFENCYVSDSPCLPSRSAMFTGKFGIHTGVVNHGGTAADPYIIGPKRAFNKVWGWGDNNNREHLTFVEALKEKANFYTVSVSPFAERHAAWWFYAGFRQMFNSGKRGQTESAKEICADAMPWLEQNAKKDNWFLHINVWDPHGPYRTTKDERVDLGEIPQQTKWLTKELLKKHRESFGPHSARETMGVGDKEQDKWYKESYPEIPLSIDSLDDFYKWIELYDQGIRYADTYLGKILKILEENKVLEDTAIIITSDHGENIGELNMYDHAAADYITNRVPFILKWPGLRSNKTDISLHYQFDVAATILELAGIKIPNRWDGKSFSKSLLKNKSEGREFLVVSNCAWTCQRSVISKDWIMIKTYHEALRDLPEIMLFNIKEDPHEINNLASKNPQLVNKYLKLLEQWHKDMVDSSDTKIDPMDTVLKEGGPFCTRYDAQKYANRLNKTGRKKHAQKILAWLKEGKYWE